MKFWTTQHFKALQKAWYQRLKDEGFEDAEEVVGYDLELKQNTEHVYRRVDGLEFVTKEAYFNFVAQRVQETIFESDVDRLIMVRHSEGCKQTHISKELELNGMRRTRDTVRYRIRTYEMKWGLKYYTPKQMNRKIS